MKLTTIEKAIREEFPGKNNTGLRKIVRRAAASGHPEVVRALALEVALTASGRMSLESVALTMEMVRDAT